MRATTHLTLLFAAVAGSAGVAAACANGGDDTSYTGGGDDGGSGDGTAGDGTTTMGDGGDGGRQGADSAPDVPMCTPTGPSSDCTMAMNLGTLTPGQMLSATGNIATAGGQAYVAVTFSGNTTPAYHPQITLADGGTEFAFDVVSDCSGTLVTCADSLDDDAGDDAGTGTLTWEEYYADAAFTSDHFVPIQPSGNDGGVLVRVYRRSGMPPSCNQYSLTVSE